MNKMGFLRDRQAVKAFESLEPARRHLVFYSEGSGDWPHVGPVIEALLEQSDRPIAYLSSDEADPGLALDDERVTAFMIGAGTARTILFARLECEHFVMTLPDLDALWLKRSVHPVHYIYLFHSMNSTHAAYRKDAFHAYDTILCVGPHHVDELRTAERVHGWRPKELVEHGSVKLDTIIDEVASLPKVERPPGRARVLVAPSWGDCSLIERPVGLELIEVLLAAGYPTVLRLHPMTVRRLPKLVKEVRRRYRDSSLFTFEDDMNAVGSWLDADLMVSDWSGAAIEYAFALGRPVIYLDTPQKAVNPDWREIDLVPFEASIRDEIGSVVDPSAVRNVPMLIEACLAEPDAMRERALAARERWVFNVGSSAATAAAYLESLQVGTRCAGAR